MLANFIKDNKVQPADHLQPRPQVGCLFDMNCAKFYIGIKGDTLISGGYTNFEVVGGKPNTFKTWLEISRMFIVSKRYGSDIFVYDAELTLDYSRFRAAAESFDLDLDQMAEEGRFFFTDSAKYDGSKFWELIKDLSESLAKTKAPEMWVTPFIVNGNPVKRIPHTVVLVDSMSGLETSKQVDIIDGNEIDSTQGNTYDLRGGAFKTKIAASTARYAKQSGMTIIYTAHIGKEYHLDPKTPPKKQLQDMESGNKFKNCPEKLAFNSSITRVIEKAADLNEDADYRKSKYPSSLKKESSKTLKELQIISLRNKLGETGYRFTVVCSQHTGLKPGLTYYNYLVDKAKYGFSVEGSGGRFKVFDLYPDKKIERTKIHDLCETDMKLVRALELTAELHQYYSLHYSQIEETMMDIPLCTLVKMITEQGITIDQLLETRNYWLPDNYNLKKHGLPSFNCVDLLNLAFQRYWPWWIKREKK